MSTGQTIQLYLPGGDEVGVRRAHFTRNSKVVVYQVPRDQLVHTLKRDDLKRPGLYFLVAPTDLRSGKVYIGESDNCAKRLGIHRNTKNGKLDWSYALIATSPAIDKADVRWLEWYYQRAVRSAERYTVVESNNTKEPLATEEEKADRLHDVEAINTLCELLGFPFTADLRPATPEVYTCKGKQALGNGCPTPNGFVVFKGSVAMATHVKSMENGLIRKRDELVTSKVLVPVGAGTLRFTKDYEFTSPSAAAAIILGSNVNGWNAWKDAEGKPLDHVRRRG